jgi:outer membrane protein
MNINTKFLLAPALALVSSAAMWGQAAKPEATKVALINMQQVIGNTIEGKAQFAELEKKYGPKQAEFQKRATDIQQKTDDLKKKQNTMSDEAKAAAEADITKLKTALQRDSDDATADSEQDEQRVLQEVGGKIVQVVTKYAQDNQIMLVFDVSSQPNNLVCCGSALDITKEVIALYDKTNSGGAAPAAKPAAAAPKPTAPSAPRPTAPAK